MNTDDFEKRLERQPLRQMPGEWREEILSAARQASPAEHAPCTRHHAPRSASLLSTIHHQLSALLWPHPAAWAGLAAAWLVILGVNVTTQDASTLVVKRASPMAPQIFMAFQEQQRLLAELVGSRGTTVAERPRQAPPRPRSERRRELLIA